MGRVLYDFRRALLRHRKSRMPVLDRLRQCAATQPTGTNGSRATVAVSIGAARVGTGETVPAAIEHADAALYRAKEAGRNRVEY